MFGEVVLRAEVSGSNFCGGADSDSPEDSGEVTFFSCDIDEAAGCKS